jgi:hypothetical protein
LAILERCTIVGGNAKECAQDVNHEAKKLRTNKHNWSWNSWLGKYVKLLFTYKKKAIKFESCKRGWELKCWKIVHWSTHDHKHGKKNFEIFCHFWIVANCGVVHQAWQPTSIKGCTWIFQVAKMWRAKLWTLSTL